MDWKPHFTHTVFAFSLGKTMKVVTLLLAFIVACRAANKQYGLPGGNSTHVLMNGNQARATIQSIASGNRNDGQRFSLNRMTESLYESAITVLALGQELMSIRISSEVYSTFAISTAYSTIGNLRRAFTARDGWLVTTQGLRLVRPGQVHQVIEGALQLLGGSTSNMQDIVHQVQNQGFFVPMEWIRGIFSPTRRQPFLSPSQMTQMEKSLIRQAKMDEMIRDSASNLAQKIAKEVNDQIKHLSTDASTTTKQISKDASNSTKQLAKNGCETTISIMDRFYDRMQSMAEARAERELEFRRSITNNLFQDFEAAAADEDMEMDWEEVEEHQEESESEYKHCRKTMEKMSRDVEDEEEDSDLLAEEQKTYPCAKCGDPIPGDAGYCHCGGARAMPKGGYQGWQGTPIASQVEEQDSGWQCMECSAHNSKRTNKCQCCGSTNSSIFQTLPPTQATNSITFQAPPSTQGTPITFQAPPPTNSITFQAPPPQAPPAPIVFEAPMPTQGSASTLGVWTRPGPAEFTFTVEPFDFSQFSDEDAKPASDEDTKPASDNEDTTNSTSTTTMVELPEPSNVPAVAGLPPWTALTPELVELLSLGDPIMVNGEEGVFQGVSRRGIRVRFPNGTSINIKHYTNVQVRQWMD